MNNKSFFAILSATALSSIAIAGAAEAMSMYRVDLNGRDPNNLQSLSLDAGLYEVELLGIADGGTYDAWSPWSSTTCPDVCGVIPATGWVYQFSFFSDDITSVNGVGIAAPGHYFASDGNRYSTAAAANAAFNPFQFTLGINSTVDFQIRDRPYTDNRGGLTLKISKIPEDTLPVPEPTSVLSLLVLGAVGTSVAIRRKQA